MIEGMTFNIAVDVTGIMITIFLIFSLFEAMRMGIRRVLLFSAEVCCIMCVLISDLFASFYSGNRDAIVLLEITNMLGYVFNYLALLIFAQYVYEALEIRSTWWKTVCFIIQAVSTVMIVLFLLNPATHMFFIITKDTALYQRAWGYVYTNIFPGLVLVTALCLIVVRKGLSRQKRSALLFACLLILGIAVFQMLFFGVNLINLAMLLGLLVIYANSFSELSREIAMQRLKLETARTELALSQIQPHFLFNVLAVIMDLCDTDAAEAKEALQEFADYLRFKISAMSQNGMISFEEDLEYTRTYLALSRRRFGNRLNVEYDISCKDFQIPLLTLQPLVENAVKHGIGQKQGGGTVRITSREREDSYCITVEDDGVGFEVLAWENLDPVHVGLKNVRSRLEALCGGRMVVKSTVGVGTTVTITIKKEKRRC